MKKKLAIFAVVMVVASVSGVTQWLLANPVAAAALGVVAWLLFLLVKPYGTCRWCKKRRNGKRWPCRRRCWRCGNTRLARRLGAYHVHKVRQSLAQAWDEREWWR